MAIVNGYATLGEAKQWVGITDSLDDTLIEDIVTSVSRWIDQYTGRQFWQTSAGAVRVFDTYDGWCLDVPDVTAVSLLKTDDNNDGTFEVTWAAGDYQLRPLNVDFGSEDQPYREIRSTGSRWFPTPTSTTRVGLIQVTGTWGWPQIPTAVNQACRMQVSRILQRRKSPEGVAGWGDFGPMRISMRLDPDVAMMLAPYRVPVAA